MSKEKPDIEVINPRYAGATPEMVGRALLWHAPQKDEAKRENQKADTEKI